MGHVIVGEKARIHEMSSLARSMQFEKASDLLHRTLAKEALPLAQALVDEGPHNFHYRYLLASIQEALGQDEEAIKALEELLKIKHNHYAALVKLGRFRNHQMLFGSALNLLLKAVAIDSQNAATYCELGWAYIGLRNAEEALASFDRALVLRHGFPPAWRGIARAVALLGHQDIAIRIIDHLIMNEPHELAFYDSAVSIALAAADFHLALRYARRAHRLVNGASPRTWLWIAQVLKAMGKHRTAIRFAQKGAKRHPDDARLSEWLADRQSFNFPMMYEPEDFRHGNGHYFDHLASEAG